MLLKIGNRDTIARGLDRLCRERNTEAGMPSLIVSAYIHDHERLQIFRVERFDSDDYQLCIIITWKSTL